MKKLILIFCTIFINYIYSANKYYGNVDYKVNNIKQNNYNLDINFQVIKNYNDIYFGFYLLNSLVKNEHNLSINLFKESQFCGSLHVIKSESSITTKGYLLILGGSEKLILESNVYYKIKITNLNNPPKNFSALPQRFFIFDNINHHAYTLKSEFLQKKYVIESKYQDNIYKFSPDPRIVNLFFDYVKWPKDIMMHDCNKQQISLCHKIKNQPEGYVINISSKIDIYANTIAGFLYANTMLKKLNYYNKNYIKKQLIIDYPRYKYRGLMLDTVRHFIPKDTLMQIIDQMAELRLNTLHLHLADDEGWRLELKTFPNLTKFGAYRDIYSKIPLIVTDDETKEGFIDDVNKGYGGFYSILEMESIINYANNKNITIIPEIDMPGHALAMKYAYESYLVDKSDLSKYFSIQGYDNNVLPICMYNYETKFNTIINGIIEEVTNIFANQNTIYANAREISIGGDEVPANSWESSIYCQKTPWVSIDDNFKSHLFFQMLANNNVNTKFSGWQQIVIDDNSLFDKHYAINNKQIGHLWNWLPSTHKHTESNLIILNQYNYPVVLSFADKFYLDIRQSDDFMSRGLYWSTNYLDAKQLLLVKNTLKQLDKLNNIVGVEASLWSELIPNDTILFFMLYPRIIVYAAIAWHNNINEVKY